MSVCRYVGTHRGQRCSSGAGVRGAYRLPNIGTGSPSTAESCLYSDVSTWTVFIYGISFKMLYIKLAQLAPLHTSRWLLWPSELGTYVFCISWLKISRQKTIGIPTELVIIICIFMKTNTYTYVSKRSIELFNIVYKTQVWQLSSIALLGRGSQLRYKTRVSGVVQPCFTLPPPELSTKYVISF